MLSPEAKQSRKEGVLGLMYGVVDEDGVITGKLSHEHKKRHIEAAERLGLTIPQDIFDAIEEKVFERFLIRLIQTSQVDDNNKHFFALSGRSEERALEFVKMTAEVYEQGLVELDAADPNIIAKLKLYAAEPVLVFLRNLAGSSLEESLRFPNGGAQMKIIDEDISFASMSSIYLPVSMQNPPIDEILDQAKMLCLESMWDSSEEVPSLQRPKPVDSYINKRLAQLSFEETYRLLCQQILSGPIVETWPELASFDKEALAQAALDAVCGIKDNAKKMIAIPSNQHLADALASFIIINAKILNTINSEERVDQSTHITLYVTLAYCVDFDTNRSKRYQDWLFLGKLAKELNQSEEDLFARISFEEAKQKIEGEKTKQPPELQAADEVASAETTEASLPNVEIDP